MMLLPRPLGPRALHKPHLTHSSHPRHASSFQSQPQPAPYKPSSRASASTSSNPLYSSHTQPASSSQPPKRPSKAQFERRILFAIVAAPIAIVTSYVLFQRLVLKVEPKRLTRREADESERVEGDEEIAALERSVGLLGERVVGEAGEKR